MRDLARCAASVGWRFGAADGIGTGAKRGAAAASAAGGGNAAAQNTAFNGAITALVTTNAFAATVAGQMSAAATAAAGAGGNAAAQAAAADAARDATAQAALLLIPAEMSAAATSYGTKADVFSLGVLLFIIVIGKFPHGQKILTDRFYKLIMEKRYDEYLKLVQANHTSKEFKELIF